MIRAQRLAEGGLLKTAAQGDTGLLLSPDAGVEKVIAVVKELTPPRAAAMRSAREQRARLLCTEVFIGRIRALLT